MARAAAIEACVPIPQVLWLLSSKESNNKNKHQTLFASRRGPRRPSGEASRRTPVRRFFFHEVTRRTRRECISGGSIVVGTILRHVLSSCGVETPQDKDVKDDFSTHVLKDVAICSNTFWILGLAQKTNRLRFPFSGVSWTTPRHEDAPQQKTLARGIGGCVRRGASIEGVRFRCKL
jgi:hypothetical protein